MQDYRTSFRPAVAAALFTWGLAAAGAQATFHTWGVAEVFSNADGTIQFVEMQERFGFDGQDLLGGKHLTTNAHDYTFPTNLPSGSTAGKRMLIATAGFAALPGAPTPDYIIPDGFVNIGGDTISLRATSTGTPVDSFTFSAGQLPTDGVTSLYRDLTTGANSPTNFAGQTGSVVVGAPSCPCETTGDSPASVDVFDLLGYLDLWFAQDPGAEFTGDEPASIDVFDLLAYLDCWFGASGGAPCP